MTAKQRSRQKKAEKHKKKREQARKTARKSQSPSTLGSLLRLASSAPFGPCWISDTLEDSVELPKLVTVVVTRVLPDGLLLPEMILVDRTCLGVKDAVVAQPMDEDTIVAGPIRQSPDTMSRCELLVAQSVIYHAIDYARSLGFEPHRDFRAALLGTRPEHLLDTPLAKPERPFYVAGPSDNVGFVLHKLKKAVGEDYYVAVANEPRD